MKIRDIRFLAICNFVASLLSFSANATGTGQLETFFPSPSPSPSHSPIPSAIMNTVANFDFRPSQIALGSFYSCMLGWDGHAYCFGQNSDGQLGIKYTGFSTPHLTKVPELNNLTSIAAGYSHTVFIDKAGKVWSTGANSYGQLGHRHFKYTGTPTLIQYFEKNHISVRQAALGRDHSCFLSDQKLVYCVGSNAYGQLGIDKQYKYEEKLFQIQGFHSVKQIAAGNYHTCLLLEDGKVFCTGSNFTSQLGDGTTITRYGFVEVKGISEVVSIAAGGDNTCFLTAQEEKPVFCVGAKNYGTQILKTGTNAFRMDYIPTPIQSQPGRVLLGVEKVAIGRDNICFILNRGRGVSCLGVNYRGVLGTGTTENTSFPVLALLPYQDQDDEKGTHTFIDVVSGWNHTCFTRDDGAVFCSGDNVYGQLGIGRTSIQELTPVQIETKF